VKTDMGGEQAPLTAQESARHLLKLIGRLTPADSGAFLNYGGEPIPW
jgi:hypothetical protein